MHVFFAQEYAITYSISMYSIYIDLHVLYMFRFALPSTSVRVEDAYLHVPGYHPTIDNPAFFHQRADNPRILPSLHRHLWGRVASLGSLILKAETELFTADADTELPTEPPGSQGAVKFSNDPLKIVGDGSCLMLEWSQPTVAALTRVVQHLRSEYKILKMSPSKADDREGEGGGQNKSDLVEFIKNLPAVDVKFRLADINGFLYSLVPGKGEEMLR